MHTLTTAEVCRILSKSEKTVQRYIKRGLLHPEETKSERGTLEYRFDLSEVERLKERHVANVQMSHKPDMTLVDRTVTVLQEQLQVKDRQLEEQNQRIRELIERDRERNILMKSMQDNLLIGQKVRQDVQEGTVSAESPVQKEQTGFWKKNRTLLFWKDRK